MNKTLVTLRQCLGDVLTDFSDNYKPKLIILGNYSIQIANSVRNFIAWITPFPSIMHGTQLNNLSKKSSGVNGAAPYWAQFQSLLQRA